MSTPPTQVAVLATIWTTLTNIDIVSGSITTQIGDVLIVRGCTAAGTFAALSTPTNTGTAETWTLQQSIDVEFFDAIYLWTATATVAQTMTVSSTKSGSATVPGGFILSQYRGSAGIGATGSTSAASSAPLLTLTTTGNNSATEVTASDYNAVDGTTRTWRTVDGTPLAEQDYFHSGDYTNYSGWDADSATAGAKDLGLTIPDTQNFTIVGVEILGAPPPLITLRTAGTATALTATATTLNPAVPAGATTGDLSVLCMEFKPYTTAITTPAGWIKIGEATNGTAANGIDVGSVKTAMYVKESAAVGAIGAITATGADTGCAVIHTYYKDPTQVWDYTSWTSGGDSTNAANYSATGGAGIAVATGDLVVAATGVNTDLGTVAAQTIAGMAGANISATTVLTTGASGNGMVTTGNDSRLIAGHAQVTVGASTAAPTMTYTDASSSSGTSLWLRLRATTPYPFGLTTPTPRYN